MKCEQCVRDGLKSIVYPGVAMSTCVAGTEFYDEDGQYHNHDPNTTTRNFRCSQWHTWTEVSRSPCYACIAKSAESAA